MKEKTIEYAHKTKELMGPFLYQTKAEASNKYKHLFILDYFLFFDLSEVFSSDIFF